MRGSVVAVAGAVLVLASSAACGDLAPVAPPEARVATALPVVPSQSLDLEAGEATVEGFTELERAALRIRNIGCGGVRTGSGFAIGDQVIRGPGRPPWAGGWKAGSQRGPSVAPAPTMAPVASPTTAPHPSPTTAP